MESCQCESKNFRWYLELIVTLSKESEELKTYLIIYIGDMHLDTEANEWCSNYCVRNTFDSMKNPMVLQLHLFYPFIWKIICVTLNKILLIDRIIWKYSRIVDECKEKERVSSSEKNLVAKKHQRSDWNIFHSAVVQGSLKTWILDKPPLIIVLIRSAA